ncbi:DUF262 domain-containing protein [Proteus terrae]|uniref:DUF262 domain-containing protein n=1 Tax=Proteus terrae TaxID=1574161 RepID=UPI0022484883|nr:DUF262 domain-containing protein [Proteus terrae]MCW9688073.1 DUF262 domain-containing protein [Proteus terrae]
MSLYDEITKARMQVHTDSYPMSIGELVNLYKDYDLEIYPEFQRIYRWTDEQKSKLIESILLGIPLPSIFVSQREDGVWDVVDGLQRISTIFSFLGELRGADGNTLPPLELLSTKYLPSLQGKVWKDETDPSREIDSDIKRIFKREKLDIKIIKRESEDDTKFELFQRLNTGGTKLSDQEVRNCILLMINPDAFQWMQHLTKIPNFIETISISEKQIQESYDQELALRFIVQRHYSEDLMKEHRDVGPYLDAELNRIFSKEKAVIDFEQEQKIFEITFCLFNKALADYSFKKFNHDKDRPEGAISIPVFEALSSSVSSYVEHNIASIDEVFILEKIKDMNKELTKTDEFKEAVLDKKKRPLDRMISMIELGKVLIQ